MRSLNVMPEFDARVLSLLSVDLYIVRQEMAYFGLVMDHALRKHAYIILTPLNPTFI